ncbi:MAG: ATP-binding protein, partial [Coxiellaceae bacterium]|nr:ATP-binding protein [Coxiellaceae bacterium]
MDLPPHQSVFLWGARQTGKSSYLKAHFADSIYYDLLDTRQVMRFLKSPYLLREELLDLNKSQRNEPIIIDEIQRVPELLNEVHWLIENEGLSFVLCGSSARQLKSQTTNLLGGRAWLYHFYPLVFPEIPDFDLRCALQHGLIPKHYLSEKKYIEDFLQAYIDIYLIEEIRNEGLVRNLQGFARFLDIVGLSNGEMINANNIARDCGIDRTTVQAYYQILVDTLLGYFVYPFSKKIKRDIIKSMPKFYLFDVGIANHLAQQKVSILKGAVAGRSFEHYIFMELNAYINYQHIKKKISYWRTKTGLEVDFIIGDAELAIEVKISDHVRQQDLKGLIAFCEEH